MNSTDQYPLWLGYMDMPEFMKHPITMVSGEGIFLYDDQGNKYADWISGVKNVALGYSEPRIIQAIYRQLQTLPFARGSSFGNQPAVELAQRLQALCSVKNPRVIFHNSGSEAVESAIKIVRQYNFACQTGKQRILTFSNGYHGQTITALSASGEEFSKEPFAPHTKGFTPIPFPNKLEDIVHFEQELASHDDIAAIMIEPLLGNAGVLELPTGFLSALRKLCDQYGVFLVCDEITTGLGRLGKWFLSDVIKPDILLVGKALTNGYLPLSATLVCEDIWSVIDQKGFFRHGQTNIHHPVCCSAGLATLEILESVNAPELFTQKGKELQAFLKPLAHSGKITGLRGSGLLYAITFDIGIHQKHQSMKWLQNAMLKEGFVIGQIENTLFIAPPLIIKSGDIEHFVSILMHILK